MFCTFGKSFVQLFHKLGSKLLDLTFKLEKNAKNLQFLVRRNYGMLSYDFVVRMAGHIELFKVSTLVGLDVFFLQHLR